MSKSTPSSTTIFAVLAILFLAPVCAMLHAQTPNDQNTVLTSTRDFLRASYPELFGKNLLLNLRITGPLDDSWKQVSEMRFAIDLYDPLTEKMLNPPFDPKTGKRLSAPVNAVLLQGNIWFNREGQLHQFSVGACEAAHSQENEAVRKLVESHPEWSEDKAVSALRRAGARYAPQNKEELLKTVEIEKYEPFFGHFTVKSVEFDGLADPHEGSFASLWWSIKLQAESPRRSNATYTLVFEPFEGKLIQVIHGLTGTMEK